jgi:hypothetical protein
VPEPQQRSNRELDDGRQRAAKRTEPRVGETDGKGHERDARQRALDRMTPSDEQDLVKRADRKHASDHHDAKGRNRKQTLLRERRA